MSEPLITTSEHLNYESHSACPKHVAIIMDGNQRWAKSRHLPKALGHREGAKNLKNIAKACANNGVEILTLFAFSTENWKRPREEVDLLIELMKGVLINDIKELCENDVRLSIIGDRSRFSPDIQLLMKNAEYLTKDCTHLTLNIAVNFGGRWDIAQAAKQMALDVVEGRLSVESVDEDSFSSYLSMGQMPHPDLCIRTGGDHRISNFLLWDMAYTELYFTDEYWPQFTERRLLEAFEEYNMRKRNYGGRTS